MRLCRYEGWVVVRTLQVSERIRYDTIRDAILTYNALSYLQPVQRPEDGSGVTEFGSFDNSTCKRVLDLLKPGDLTLGQVVIKRVAGVELGVNNGSGNGGGCFGIEVWTDTAKLTDMVIARFGDR